MRSLVWTSPRPEVPLTTIRQVCDLHITKWNWIDSSNIPISSTQSSTQSSSTPNGGTLVQTRKVTHLNTVESVILTTLYLSSEGTGSPTSSAHSDGRSLGMVVFQPAKASFMLDLASASTMYGIAERCNAIESLMFIVEGMKAIKTPLEVCQRAFSGNELIWCTLYLWSETFRCKRISPCIVVLLWLCGYGWRASSSYLH